MFGIILRDGIQARTSKLHKQSQFYRCGIFAYPGMRQASIPQPCLSKNPKCLCGTTCFGNGQSKFLLGTQCCIAQGTEESCLPWWLASNFLASNFLGMLHYSSENSRILACVTIITLKWPNQCCFFCYRNYGTMSSTTMWRTQKNETWISTIVHTFSFLCSSLSLDGE